jgi:glycogen phosphorylase
LDQCNPALSTLITKTLGSRAWLKDLYLLKGLLKHDSDPAFHKKWAAAKANNKERLAAYIKTTLGITIDSKAMFAIHVCVSYVLQRA